MISSEQIHRVGGHAGDPSIVTVAGFLVAFCALDEVAGLAAPAAIPTSVLCGSDDPNLPGARLVRVA